MLIVGLALTILYPALVWHQLAYYFKQTPYQPTLFVEWFSAVSAIGVLVFSLCALPFTSNKKLKTILRFLPFIFVLCNALIIFSLTAPVDPKFLYTQGNPYFQDIILDTHTNNPANIRIISPYSPQTNMYYGLSTLNGYNAVYPKTTENLIHAINYPQTTLQLSTGAHGSANAIYVGNTNKTNLLENLGIQYIIGLANTPINGYTKIDQVADNDVAGHEYALYRANNFSPQVYFASSITELNREQQLQAIKQNSLTYHQISIANIQQPISGNFSGGQPIISISMRSILQLTLIRGTIYLWDRQMTRNGMLI